MVVMHNMVRMVSMNLTMLRYLNAKGARLSQGKPNQRVMACVVLVGLQRSTHRDCPFNTKRSTAKTSTKPVIVPVDSPSQSSDAVSDVVIFSQKQVVLILMTT